MTAPLDIGVVGKNLVRHDGQGRAVLELVRELVERGHRVTVYAHRLDPELKDRTAFVSIPSLPGPVVLDDLFTLAWATWKLRRSNHTINVVLGPTALPRRPFVFNSQFSHRGWRATWRPESRPGLAHRLHAYFASFLEDTIVRRSAMIVASTEQVGREMAAGPGIPIVAVPLGIAPDENLPPTDQDRRTARAELGLADDDVAVSFLGGYSTGRKGLFPLLEAIAKGHEHLLVAGGGDPALVRARVAALGIAPRVHLLGFVPAAQVMAAADISAVPSLYEPFSLVALEAAHRGIPGVVSRVAGVTPYLSGAIEVIADANDPSCIREALDRAFTPEARQAARLVGPEAAGKLAWRLITGPAADAVEGMSPRR